MAFLGLLAGLFLPWLLGVVWLRARWLKADEINWPTLLGYGYLAGALATTMVMRVLSLIGVRLGFTSIGLTLLALIAAGMRAGWGTRLRRPDFAGDWRELSGWKRIAFAMLLAVIVLRLCGLGMEIVWRPLFPWDAWSQWATKARVWYELGRMVPFVSNEVWLAGTVAGAYTDFAPHYPPAISLLQAWTCFSLGRWDDALMNLPWLACAIALGLAFYGQARAWSAPPLLSLVFTYFLLSLPLLDTHVALAGYADLFMAGFVGLAAIAFFHWVRARGRWHGTMALLFAIGCAFIKQPGIAWMLTFLPAVVVATSPRIGRIGMPMLAAATLLILFVLGEAGNVNVFGYTIQSLRHAVVWEPVGENFMLLDNWHLLGHLALLAVILPVLPQVRSFSRQYSGMGALILSGIFFLVVIFSFTKASAWAEDYSTLNRALLHMMPMVTFYLLVVFKEIVMPGLAYGVPVRSADSTEESAK